MLKASLYLSESLPIQYKVKNFTRKNLRIIEGNWENIKKALSTTVRSNFPLRVQRQERCSSVDIATDAFFLMKRKNWSFDTSSKKEDAQAQIAIRRWFIFSTLKNAFGGSSDTTLTRLRELLISCDPMTAFPVDVLFKSLEIEPRLNDAEIDRILGYGYQGRYTYLVLSLLYPDHDWKDAIFHEDHIFPQAEFQLKTLKKRNYSDAKIQSYLSKYNVLSNLELQPIRRTCQRTPSLLKSGFRQEIRRFANVT